jgi:aminomethyltransferase
MDKHDLKQTPLRQVHVDACAKLVEFAGFEMPLRYAGVIEEHLAVRHAVGVFDVSHMGEFIVEGEEALNLIALISSNNPANLVPGKAQYSCMPNDKGGIIDDFITYRLDEKKFMLVVNASNIEKDWDWITKHNEFNASLTDISSETALLAVQGPGATQLLQPLTQVDLGAISFYNFETGSMAGIENVIISATGYTGSGGFELYVSAEHAEKLWRAIFDANSSITPVPAGLGARDTLRLEMGYCLYGNDIDDTTSPLEAGLGWITKFDHEFVNARNLLSQKEDGIERKLIGFTMGDKGIPRQGYELKNLAGDLIGKVTSGSHSPCLEKGIGLGYVSTEEAKIGNEILVQIRKKQLSAIVTKLPFYRKPVS